MKESMRRLEDDLRSQQVPYYVYFNPLALCVLLALINSVFIKLNSMIYIELADNPRKLRRTIKNQFIVADTDTLKYLNRFVFKVI